MKFQAGEGKKSAKFRAPTLRPPPCASVALCCFCCYLQLLVLPFVLFAVAFAALLLFVPLLQFAVVCGAFDAFAAAFIAASAALLFVLLLLVFVLLLLPLLWFAAAFAAAFAAVFGAAFAAAFGPPTVELLHPCRF